MTDKTETKEIYENHYVFENLEPELVIHIDDKEKEVPCRIVETVHNLEEAMGSDAPAKYHVELKIVPTELTEEHKESIFGGIPDSEEAWDDEYVRSVEIANYGLGVPAWRETGDNVKELKEKARKQAPSIEALIGFYLDKPVNKVGSTGWDILKDALTNESWMDAGLERAKEKRNKEKLDKEV